MAIIRWEPFRMEDFPELRLPKIGNDMAVDVYERGNNVVAQMQLSGVNPDEIDIDIEDNFVRVAGVREEISENEEADYYYKEIQRGSFERSFRLPTKVNAEAATAEFEDGVLTLILPKMEERKARKVAVKKREAKAEKPTEMKKPTEPKPKSKTTAKKSSPKTK